MTRRPSRTTTATCLLLAVSLVTVPFAATGGCGRGKDRGRAGKSGGVDPAAAQARDRQAPLEVKQGGEPPTRPVDKPEPPLNVAARAGDVEAVRGLLEGGADVNAFGDDNMTALMAAAGANQQDVVKLLLQRGADANLRDAKGRTASQVAQEKGHAAVVQLLERNEVKPPPVDTAGPATAPGDAPGGNEAVGDTPVGPGEEEGDGAVPQRQ